MTGITVTRCDGRLLAVKRADPDRPERLRHEAAVLARVDHPGVIDLVEITGTDPIELRTLFVGPDSWDRRPPRGERQIVDGLAAVAATVADLHDLGTTHGALDPSHVITAGDGRPVLCGLGQAAEADDDARHHDMVGLASLLEQVGADLEGEGGRRFSALVARLRDDSLDARMLARHLDDLGPHRGPLTDRRRPTRLTVGAATLGLAAIAAVVWALARSGSMPDRTVDAGPSATSQTVPAITATATPTTTARRPATTASTVTPTTSTTAGSAPGTELTHDGRRYLVGREGDTVMVRDWDCDGVPTPAVLRPPDDTVAVFDTWPTPGASIGPAHLSTVAGARSLEPPDPDVCNQLRVRTTTGSHLIVLEDLS